MMLAFLAHSHYNRRRMHHTAICATVGADAHIGPQFYAFSHRADVGIGPYEPDYFLGGTILWKT